MKLLLFLAFSIAAFGQCAVVVTSATATTCVPMSQLVGPPGPTGPQGVPGPQGPVGPAGAGIPTITVAGGVTTITGPLVVTGSITTGAAGVPTVWQITRQDGVACTGKFLPTNPSSNATTVLVITCP